MLFGLLSINLFSQDNNNSATIYQISQRADDNELRLNFPALILGVVEVNYEKFIADDAGIGLAASVTVDKVENLSRRWYALPYYRLYFGKQKASGFFIEGNIALVSQKEFYTQYQYNGENQSPSYPTYERSTTNFGFGGAIGAKLLARNGFIGEIFAGGGRLFGNSIAAAYPRIGICIGKRF